MKRSSLILAAVALVLWVAACDRAATPSAAPTTSAASAEGNSPEAATTAAPVATWGDGGGPPVYEKTILSSVYEVDKVYKSMQGPQSTKEVALRQEADLELLWIVGFEAIMV
jgi:hypothetical protein